MANYGTLSVDTITNSGGDVFTVNSGQYGFKNRIINGAMVIDQRNAGGTVSSHLSFPVDRMQIVKDTSSGTFTMGQSSVVPSLGGFNKSILFTVGTAYTPSSGENNFFKHLIEGYNVADLVWGTANATAVTLSFWVRSSITGTYGGSLRNGSSNRSYVFTYTINSANTFEYKTITIPGDTSGTWLTTNGNGLEISWGLSVGSTFLNTAGAWYTGNYISATGATQITPTAGATWYITGVQLEKGSTATSFDYRPYSVELQMCQRYFASTFSQGTAVLAANASNSNGLMGKGGTSAAAEPYVNWSLPVEMRTAPTCTTYNPYTGGTAGQFGNGAGSFGASSGARVVATSTRSVAVDNSGTTLTAGNQYSICISGTAEL